jgi:hypothetical protein
MSTARTPTMSPLFQARLGGFSWFMCFLTGIYPVMISGRLIVAGDAATTATNLLAHEGLYRFGIGGLLISTAFYIVATLFVYEVLKPVNRSLSLLAAFFSLVGCAVGAFSCLFDLVPLVLLKNAPYLGVFTIDQRQALALMFLKVRLDANNLGLVFFGLHCLGVGYLIVRSIFLPRIIGVLMLIAGVAWISFVFPFVQSLVPFAMMPGAIGEVSLALFLMIRGVNVPRWHQQAGNNPRSDL